VAVALMPSTLYQTGRRVQDGTSKWRLLVITHQFLKA
jgi:hypothetical protein